MTAFAPIPVTVGVAMIVDGGLVVVVGMAVIEVVDALLAVVNEAAVEG